MAIRGTIEELINRNISVNGVKLGPAELSVLTRLGKTTFAKNVGTFKKLAGGKGKPAIIWELADATELKFTQTQA
jgi:hypothetical protein